MTTLLTAYSAFTRAADLCVFAHDGNAEFIVNSIVAAACCVLLYLITAFAMQRNKSVRDFLSGRVLPETKISELTVCKINFTNKADSSRIASSFH